jgi:hypothetical protein
MRGVPEAESLGETFQAGRFRVETPARECSTITQRRRGAQTMTKTEPETEPETEPRIETPYTNADDAPWRARLASAVLGPPARHGGLCLYPLLGDEGGAAPYLLLDAALAAGTLTIEEADGGGTVPALVLTNTGDARVLLLDGEELVGAKQNRIVNTSVLVGAHSRLSLPVTCVEAGRWRQESERFSSGRSHYNARGRQKKVAEVSASLARSGRAEADQSRVWSDIGGKLARLSVASETSALHDVARSYGTDLAGYAEALATPRPRQVGAAFALGRELVGVDLFDRADTLATVLPKLVASYALDALEEATPDAPPPPAAVAAWLQALASAAPTPRGAVGLGVDVRLSAPRLSGAALEFEGTCLHLSAFAVSGHGGPDAPAPPSRLARPSQRRG